MINKNSKLKDFKVFEEKESLKKDLKATIQSIIGFLRAIIFNTIYYKAYIFWTNKEYLQFFFSKLNDLFILTAQLHPVLVLIISDFIKKFYYLLITNIDMTDIIYKSLTQKLISQNNSKNYICISKNKNTENKNNNFYLDVRIIKIYYLENFVHFLIYSKRLYGSYVNVSLLKYFNFIYEIIFIFEKDIFFFSSQTNYLSKIIEYYSYEENNYNEKSIKNRDNFDNNLVNCNINKIIFKFLLQIGYCNDIEKINYYKQINTDNLFKQNKLLERLSKDLTLNKSREIEDFYKAIGISINKMNSQFVLILLYLENFGGRNIEEKTNILEMLILFYKTLINKFIEEGINISNLIRKVEKALIEIEIQNHLFSQKNKFFDVEENLESIDIPIKPERRLESLEKNVFQLKTFFNLQEKKQKLPNLEEYDIGNKKYLQNIIDNVLEKKNKFFSFNLEFNDFVKYFMCNIYQLISNILKDDKKKLQNIKQFKSTKIKNFLDLLDFNNFDLINFDTLYQLIPDTESGEKISLEGAINFLKISTLFNREIKRYSLIKFGVNFQDETNYKCIYSKNENFSNLFDNIVVNKCINSNTNENDLLYLLKYLFFYYFIFSFEFHLVFKF